MKHLRIQHLFNNPKKYSSCDQYPKNYKFSKFKTQKILRWSLSVNMPSPPPGNSNERLWKTVNGHESLSTTLKDSQRLAVIPKDPETRMTAKDRQQHSATGNDYMETRLNNWRNGV